MPTLHVEEMEEVCALCNVYVGEGTAKAKRLRLFGDSAVDTREQMDMFLYQELVENVWQETIYQRLPISCWQ